MVDLRVDPAKPLRSVQRPDGVRCPTCLWFCYPSKRSRAVGGCGNGTMSPNDVCDEVGKHPRDITAEADYQTRSGEVKALLSIHLSVPGGTRRFWRKRTTSRAAVGPSRKLPLGMVASSRS